MTEQVTPAGAPAANPGIGGAQQPVDGEAPKQPSKARGAGRRIVGGLVGAAVVFGGGIAWKYISGDPETAKVGSCMIETAKADDMKTVDCNDPKAAHKVVGKVEGMTEATFKATDNPCTAYPTAESALWGSEKGGKGYVLCLEPIKK